MLRYCLSFLCLIVLQSSAWATTPFSRTSIPDPLKSWVPWVLDGQINPDCPHFFDSFDQRHCAWPGVLELKVNPHGAEFAQTWQVYADTWISLPGGAKHWPQHVLVDGKAWPVVEHEEMPSIKLDKGNYRISGSFLWDAIPESLELAANLALLRLELNGQLVANPVRDESNQLWLQRKAQGKESDEARLQVFRKISDEVPLLMESRFHLDVSGKGREIKIGRALLPEFVAQGLDSPLPVRLGLDGELWVQVRAGSWDIRLTARHSKPIKTIVLPQSDGMVAEDEIWVFAAAPLLRTTMIEDAQTIDTQQTSLPSDWRGLPAYLMRADSQHQRLTMKEIRRGDSDPGPDKLNVERRLWMSFDGSSMSLSDQISGQINRAGRLAMTSEVALGRLAIDGQNQQITVGSDHLAGIELSRGPIKLAADGVMPKAPRSFAANAWMKDVDHLGIELILPAGWRLLHVSGVDHAEGAWLSRWNLLDFFIVLMIALGTARLWGRYWGGVALLALGLSYQEVGAPQWAWIAVLLAIALLRVLPDGRLKRLVAAYHKIAALLLVLLCLGFATAQIRAAIYPVLEHGGFVEFQHPVRQFELRADVKDTEARPMSPPENAENAPVMAVESNVPAFIPPPEISLNSARHKSSSTMAYRAPIDAAPAPSQYRTIDTDAQVQTGAGLPTWNWQAHHLSFDGPVSKDQQVHLWLLSPWMVKSLTVLRLMLIAALLLCLLGKQGGSGDVEKGGAAGLFRRLIKKFAVRSPTSVPGVALLILMGFVLQGLSPSQVAQAQTPSSEQLQQLQEKLLRPADCLPQCAEVSSLSVQVSGQTARLILDVDASIASALPLPGGAKYWQPYFAQWDGKSAYVLRAEDGQAWVLAPVGRHRLELIGDLMQKDTLQLALPRKPRHVEVHAEGWDVVGLSDENGVADSLQLSRQIKQAGNKVDEAANLPAFLNVTRHIHFDKEWTVSTTVTRVNASTAPALSNIPLLLGESVTSTDIHVKEGAVEVNLGPQSNSVTWNSTLKQNMQMKLGSRLDATWFETWILDVSSQWHLNIEGLPPIASANNVETALEFRPWPGETLVLNIERPKVLAGQTVTIDQSHLKLIPGAHSSDYELRLQVRSSRGSDQVLSLPQGAQLLSVVINGQARPLRAQGEKLTIPLVPGVQEIVVVWRVNQGMQRSFNSLSVNLGATSVNSEVEVMMPQDRWLLLVSGQGLGPAILFWGQLIVLLLVAMGIAKWQALHLRARDWILLALGLTQVPWWAAVVVFTWFFAVHFRARGYALAQKRWEVNLRQVLLALHTLATAMILFFAVQHGLLGLPDMQVAGNHSTYFDLNWYLDRAAPDLQSVWILSLPMLVYRLLMLLWALWLAWSILAWIKWGWAAYSLGELWRSKPVLVVPVKTEITMMSEDKESNENTKNQGEEGATTEP